MVVLPSGGPGAPEALAGGRQSDGLLGVYRVPGLSQAAAFHPHRDTPRKGTRGAQVTRRGGAGLGVGLTRGLEAQCSLPALVLSATAGWGCDGALPPSLVPSP